VAWSCVIFTGETCTVSLLDAGIELLNYGFVFIFFAIRSFDDADAIDGILM